MLLEYSVSNFKSIGNEVVFSMLSGADDSNKETLLSFGKNNFGNKSIIYGANGSGKSALLESLAFLKSIILSSFQLEPGQGIRVPSHKLFQDQPTIFSIQFVKENIRYAYSCTIQNFQIIEEYLFYFPKGRQAKIFERKENSFSFGQPFRGKLKPISDGIKPNKLLLSVAANLTSLNEIDSVYTFFSEDIVLYRTEDINQNQNWFNYSLYQLHENSQRKEQVLQFLQYLAIPINNLEITIKKDHPQMDELPPFLSEDFKVQLISGEVDRINAKVVYDSFSLDLFSEESSGIRKLFEFLCPFLDIMEKGKVLFCDEIETCLHESIVYKLIEFFDKSSGKNKAQLICTSHDTNLLDLDLFRRDQIWFTELKPDTRSTDLYSLTEIKDVRKGTNVSKNYKEGKYGAIPMLRDIHHAGLNEVF